MCRSSIVLASLLALASFGVSSAVADTKSKSIGDASKMVTDDCARATKLKKECVMNMESEKIGGETPGASGSTVVIIDWGKAGSLIRLRRDFITEIIKTAEDL